MSIQAHPTKRDKDTETIFDIGTILPAPVDSVFGIEYVFASNKKVIAEMTITEKHTQPMNLLHGGVSCVIAESVGSVASNLATAHDPTTSVMVGLSLVANHLKSGMCGDRVVATATPIHVGKSSHLWNIDITSKQYGYMICTARLTTHVMKLDSEKHKAEFFQHQSRPTTPGNRQSKPVNTETAKGNNSSSQQSSIQTLPFKPTAKILPPFVAQSPDGSYPVPACL